jgi:hypothetical protein
MEHKRKGEVGDLMRNGCCCPAQLPHSSVLRAQLAQRHGDLLPTEFLDAMHRRIVPFGISS